MINAKVALAICITGLLHSCLPYKQNRGTQITVMNGLRLVCNKEKNIHIYYGWDYWFHDLKKKNTLNWNDDFVTSIGWDNHQKELLFSGHTIIEPYCSSIGLLYRKAEITELVKGLGERMRKELKAENVFITEEIVGQYSYTILTYDLRNEQFKVHAKYREYFSKEENDVLRIVFWSVESCPNWEVVKGEGDAIMKSRIPVVP